MSAFAVGIGSLLGGLALFVVAGWISLHSYDQVSDPGWLTALTFVAVALVVVGLLVMVDRAVRVSRGKA